MAGVEDHIAPFRDKPAADVMTPTEAPGRRRAVNQRHVRMMGARNEFHYRI